MEMEHSFTVPVPENRAWEVLLDVERVAPCMPGATLDSVEGDEIKGRIRVKVGPISMTYAGTARFTERDPAAHVITLQASGKETRGAGTASATVRSMLEGQGEATHVVVHTTLNITGKPAQFGRGVMAEVGGKLIGIFATNLAEMLAGNPPEAAAGNGSQAGTSATGAAPAEAGPDRPLEELALPVRAYNALRRDGVHTVNELAACSPAGLLAIEGIGPASVEDIRRRLADLGLTLGEQPPGQDAGPSPVGTVPVGTVSASTGPASTGARAADAWAGLPDDDDAIDLLSVAGLPVLRRLVPVLAGLAALALVLIGARSRRRRRR